MLGAPETAQQLRDTLVTTAELTGRDFIGVYQVVPPWSSLGHCQRGAAQPEWPIDEPFTPLQS